MNFVPAARIRGPTLFRPASGACCTDSDENRERDGCHINSCGDHGSDFSPRTVIPIPLPSID